MPARTLALLLLAVLYTPVVAGPVTPNQDVPADVRIDRAAPRWQADEVLESSMEHVQAAVDGYAHFEHGHMNREQAGILADLIDGRVRTIVENCRLAPAADAALHEVLHALIEGAAALKRDPTSASAIASLREATASYRRLFDPPAKTRAEPGQANAGHRH